MVEMEKELALALDFKNAPKELQQAATAHYANIKALAKAKAKVVSVGAELSEAEKVFHESAKALRIALKNWNPTIESVAKESR